MQSDKFPSCTGSSQTTQQKRAAFRSKLALNPLSIARDVAVAAFDSRLFPQFEAPVPLSEIFTTQTHLASGALGAVFQCSFSHLDGAFAVKTVKVHTDEVLAIAVKEYEVLSKLRHPGIVSVFRLYLDAESATAAMIMEYIPGLSIAQLLASGFRFTETEVQSIARQVFATLAYIHSAGIVHRDVNPANIIVSQGLAKLIDFQTARECREVANKGVVGTAPFQAPEMWDELGYDCKVDVLVPSLSTGSSPLSPFAGGRERREEAERERSRVVGRSDNHQDAARGEYFARLPRLPRADDGLSAPPPTFRGRSAASSVASLAI